MHFTSTVLSALGFAALAQAGTLAFENKDRFDLVDCFIPNSDGSRVHDGVFIPAGQTVHTNMDAGWSGAIFTIRPGEDAIHKFYVDGVVQAEIKWNGNFGLTNYDISVLRNCCDNDGVHRIWAEDTGSYNTGCYRFPCDGVYNFVGDNAAIHTTPSDHMVIQVGLENRLASFVDPDPSLNIRKASYPARHGSE